MLQAITIQNATPANSTTLSPVSADEYRRAVDRLSDATTSLSSCRSEEIPAEHARVIVALVELGSIVPRRKSPAASYGTERVMGRAARLLASSKTSFAEMLELRLLDMPRMRRMHDAGLIDISRWIS